MLMTDCWWLALHAHPNPNPHQPHPTPTQPNPNQTPTHTSLFLQVSKYVALFSSKGYAIGENFAQWLAHKLNTNEQLAGELISHVEVCCAPA